VTLQAQVDDDSAVAVAALVDLGPSQREYLARHAAWRWRRLIRRSSWRNSSCQSASSASSCPSKTGFNAASLAVRSAGSGSTMCEIVPTWVVPSLEYGSSREPTGTALLRIRCDTLLGMSPSG